MGEFKYKKELTSEQKERIAGDAIEIIKLGNFAKTTFFVEDEFHELVIRELAGILGKSISVSVCGNSSNVKSIHNLSLKDGVWPNSYFIVDGDGANPRVPDGSLITLDRYCLENYFIDLRVITEAYGKTEDDVKKLILDSILEKRDTILKRNKFFDFLIDQMREEHITNERLGKLDGSEIIDGITYKLGTDKNSHAKKCIKIIASDINKYGFCTYVFDAIKTSV